MHHSLRSNGARNPNFVQLYFPNGRRKVGRSRKRWGVERPLGRKKPGVIYAL